MFPSAGNVDIVDRDLQICQCCHWTVCLAAAGAYRVFSCATDATGDDLIIAAVERAYRDGAQVINL
jgi:hypothetical protein